MSAATLAEACAVSVAHARAYAVRAHGAQLYGERPYVYHLDAVAALLEPYGVEAQIIGYLHDVLEDTPRTLNDLTREFGSRIARCVDLVTDPPGIVRAQRKARLCAQLWGIKPWSDFAPALVVKAADRLANVRASREEGREDLLAMYRVEHPMLRAAARRPGLCDELWTELDQRLA